MDQTCITIRSTFRLPTRHWLKHFTQVVLNNSIANMFGVAINWPNLHYNSLHLQASNKTSVETFYKFCWTNIALLLAGRLLTWTTLQMLCYRHVWCSNKLTKLALQFAPPLGFKQDIGWNILHNFCWTILLQTCFGVARNWPNLHYNLLHL